MSIGPISGYDRWKLDNGPYGTEDLHSYDCKCQLCVALDEAETTLAAWERLYDEEEEEADRADEAREEEDDQ